MHNPPSPLALNLTPQTRNKGETTHLQNIKTMEKKTQFLPHHQACHMNYDVPPPSNRHLLQPIQNTQKLPLSSPHHTPTMDRRDCKIAKMHASKQDKSQFYKQTKNCKKPTRKYKTMLNTRPKKIHKKIFNPQTSHPQTTYKTKVALSQHTRMP